ncbi:hypothetical protein AUP07_0512 [methanogenic archaeon mixed culture ISO4-G1]|nr:hypothetical protein AUP07_0512 [methanogenic archaeon mixed culture ISO4-G1]
MDSNISEMRKDNGLADTQREIHEDRSYEAYLKMDLSPYEGEVIGLCDGVLVAHSKSFQEVFDKTAEVCGRDFVPFIMYVPPEDFLFLRYHNNPM